MTQFVVARGLGEARQEHHDENDPQRAIAELLDLGNHCNAIAIGPGLGLSDAMGEIVRGVMAATPLPMVADASALFHLTKHLPEFAGKTLILTPHAGEFARLSGKGTVESSERLRRLPLVWLRFERVS